MWEPGLQRSQSLGPCCLELCKPHSFVLQAVGGRGRGRVRGPLQFSGVHRMTSQLPPARSPPTENRLCIGSLLLAFSTPGVECHRPYCLGSQGRTASGPRAGHPPACPCRVLGNSFILGALNPSTFQRSKELISLGVSGNLSANKPVGHKAALDLIGGGMHGQWNVTPHWPVHSCSLGTHWQPFQTP